MYLLAGLLSFQAVAQTVGSIGLSASPLLTPWAPLRGAFVAAPKPGSATAGKPGFSGYLSWQSPTLVAVRNNYIYVADSGRRRIFRYDQARLAITPFTEHSAATVSGMAVAMDLSLYVADINARQVVHYSFDGQLLQKFSNELELVRPVAVLLEEFSGTLWVADSLYTHVVVFNSLGRVLSVLRSNEARSIEGMAQGPDGLYLLDRLGRQIAVLGRDGRDLYTLGQGILKMPEAVAVDRFNRVFVSDSFDNTLKVFEQGQLVASVGGSGVLPISFNRVTGLWIDQNMLYVVDSLNARIQTFHIAPPGAPARPLAE